MASALNKKEKEYIIKNYKIKTPEIIGNKLGRTKSCIFAFLRRNNLKYNRRKLSPTQEKILLDNYSRENVDWIAKKINKTPRVVMEWAKKYKIYNKRIPSGDLSPLLSGSLESFYWLGFIAADGTIDKKGKLQISQAEKDRNTICLMANYLKGKVMIRNVKGGFNKKSTIVYELIISHKEITDKIREFFGLTDITKTHAGIKLDFIKSPEQAMCFLMGFMDGDANIRHNHAKIQCYRTWLEVFQKLSSLLPLEYQDGIIKLEYKEQQDSYYANWILRSQPIRKLKKFALENNIPISERKWVVVDHTKIWKEGTKRWDAKNLKSTHPKA